MWRVPYSRNGLGIPDYSREFAGAELGDEIIEPIDADSLKSGLQIILIFSSCLG